MSEYAARVLSAPSRSQLGEGPTWDERTQTLHWVDIERGELHRCRADGSGESSVRLGQRIGCIALRRDAPGFIAGLEHSIAYVSLDPLEIRAIAAIETDVPGNRCNDGKCDAAGRFWVGTCDDAMQRPTGWF